MSKLDPNRPQAHGRDPKSTRKVIKPATQHLGEVRLIGGQWKRSKLPVADRPGLRPSPDRVRETQIGRASCRERVLGAV